MLYKIENEYIYVEFRSQGAEIVRFFDKEKQQDIIWEQNPEIWKYHAPLLFPKIGSINPSGYYVGSEHYAMANHGFLRTSEFNVKSHSEDTIEFELTQNETTLSVYPYEFNLNITYRIEKKSLAIQISIKNNDKKVLPFELGFHPAFKIQSYLTTKVVFPTQFVERYSYLNKPELRIRRRTRNVIHLAQRFFDRRGTMIYRGINTPYVLVTPNYNLKFECSEFPYLAIWSTHESFVCVEPWTHLPDLFENKANWVDRDNVIRLATHESKKFNIKLSIV